MQIYIQMKTCSRIRDLFHLLKITNTLPWIFYISSNIVHVSHLYRIFHLWISRKCSKNHKNINTNVDFAQ